MNPVFLVYALAGVIWLVILVAALVALSYAVPALWKVLRNR